MNKKRKVYSAKFKAKVALDALRERSTLSELSTKYELHGNQISQWKQVAVKHLEEAFSQKRGKSAQEDEALVHRLYRQIGQLQVELEWLKKKSGL